MGEELQKSINEIAVDIACIKQAVLGDGKEIHGLCYRVNMLEEHKDKENRARGLLAGFWMFTGGALAWLYNMFKG